MKKIITYGTFDLFHIGHLEILRRAKELGDYLVVVISTDEAFLLEIRPARTAALEEVMSVIFSPHPRLRLL